MPRRVARGGKRAPARRARRAPKRQLTTVNRSLQPIPDRYICKMKYATTVSTDLTGQYIFNLNSLFDPDRTSFGHQPYGYDNLTVLYNRYRVISCGWRICMPANYNGVSILLGSLPNNDPGISYLNDGEMRENPRTKYVLQNPGATSLVLKGKQNIATLMGRTKQQYMADDSYQAVTTASPNELGLLYLQTFTATTGLPLGSIPVNVTLEFTAEFFDLKHVVQS